jgi:hypothetical protein
MFREEREEYRCCEWRRGEGGKKDDIKAYQPKYFKMAIKKFKSFDCSLLYFPHSLLITKFAL